MKKFQFLIMLLVATLAFTSCKENYSNGNRVGFLTKFNEEGVIFKSYEGELNVTQTGMNTGTDAFNFSVDRFDRVITKQKRMEIINLMDSALIHGWKVQVVYHKVWGLKNIWRVRGDQKYFVDNIIVLDRNFNPFGNNAGSTQRIETSAPSYVPDEVVDTRINE